MVRRVMASNFPKKSTSVDLPLAEIPSRRNPDSSLNHSYPDKERRRSIPSGYLMPGFDPAAISDKLESAFKGEGTAVEQTALYIDPSSGSRWYAVANQSDYVDARTGQHYKEIAQHISHHFLKGIQTLDVFALGSGDGNNETRLVQNLLPYIYPINFFLVDVSNPLLNIAFNHAKQVLGPSMRDHIYTVLGTIHDLAQGAYTDLYQPQLPGTRRLVTMLGYTFGNLESELQFVRNNLCGFGKGDLLLLDLVLAYAPADKPEEVQASDPRLTRAHGPGWDRAYEEFLSNTIHRYCKDVKKIDFIQELDYGACTVPGSYAVSIRAKVQTYDKKVRTFAMMLYKRYDINKLVVCMEKLGWRGSTGWHYGSNNQMMYLFEKVF